MMGTVDLPLILMAALVAGASPGPATLAIAGTSMAHGRAKGLALAAGITTGSLIWSVSAALGLSALMLANGWMLEVIRYVGAAYLIFLAFKSAKSAMRPTEAKARQITGSGWQVYSKGVALHVTNPKAVLFFGALYAIGIPQDAPVSALVVVICAIAVQSALVFHGYALLFSNRLMTRAYMRMKRGFEAAFAIGFGAAGFKILTARLN